MDITDTATAYEEVERTANIEAARRPITIIEAKRRALNEARELATQRGADDAEVKVALTCHNCGDPLSIESEDVFCSKECAEDWERRARIAKINGKHL